MTNPLEVLVLEYEAGAADDTVRALEDAGHSVRRCREANAPAFPCSSVAGGACPLHEGSVDVAVTVRNKPSSAPSGFEDGVSCALQHRVPLVVAGSVGVHPFADHATTVVESHDDDIVGAIEAAARSRRSEHERRAVLAAREVLERRGIPGAQVSAMARRRRGGVRVELTLPVEIDDRAKEMVAVRVHAALSSYDRHARTIDVAMN